MNQPRVCSTFAIVGEGLAPSRVVLGYVTLRSILGALQSDQDVDIGTILRICIPRLVGLARPEPITTEEHETLQGDPAARA